VFAAMLMRTRARDVLLPVVLYPILVPLFIAAIKGTSALLVGDTEQAWFWIRFLLVYDSSFVVAALWTFESVVIE
jgi:ABC-type transport system involved in cytochrome c biogenesis permease component